jgi:hypothetical protein
MDNLICNACCLKCGGGSGPLSRLTTTERQYAKQWHFATRGQGRSFCSLMACGKYEILYTDILDCGTWNSMEWPQVLYSYLRLLLYVAGDISARSYTIRYIMTRRALLHLTTSVQFNCFVAVSRNRSPVAR